MHRPVTRIRSAIPAVALTLALAGTLLGPVDSRPGTPIVAAEGAKDTLAVSARPSSGSDSALMTPHAPSADNREVVASTVTCEASADTHVFEGAPTANFGDVAGKPRTTPPDDITLLPALHVGADDSELRTNGRYRGFIRFDGCTIPRSALVLDSTISIYFVSRYDWNNRVRRIGFFEVTGDWSEMGVTWNTRPSASNARVASLPLDSGVSSGDQSIFGWKDVALATQLTQRWVSGESENRGLMLQDDESEDPDVSTLRSFGTREGRYGAKLTIAYTLDGATATRTPTPHPTATLTPTRTPTREATATARPSATATEAARPSATPVASSPDLRSVVFLPFTAFDAFDWPTPAALVATPRPPCENVLANGDFEAGASGWILESTGIPTGIQQGTAHSGLWSVRLGGRSGSRDTLRNEAVIRTFPADDPVGSGSLASATLRFAWRMPTAESGGAYDKLVVRLVGETDVDTVDVVQITNAMTKGKWIDEREGFDVAEHLARRSGWRFAELQFVAINDSSAPTTWDVDDVRLDVCVR